MKRRLFSLMALLSMMLAFQVFVVPAAVTHAASTSHQTAQRPSASYVCSGPMNIATSVEILNNQNVYCFGNGYAGFRINDPFQYSNNTLSNAWVRIYPDGKTSGCFLDLPILSHANHSGYFDGHHSITQIGVGGSHGSPTCP